MIHLSITVHFFCFKKNSELLANMCTIKPCYPNDLYHKYQNWLIVCLKYWFFIYIYICILTQWYLIQTYFLVNLVWLYWIQIKSYRLSPLHQRSSVSLKLCVIICPIHYPLHLLHVGCPVYLGVWKNPKVNIV